MKLLVNIYAGNPASSPEFTCSGLRELSTEGQLEVISNGYDGAVFLSIRGDERIVKPYFSYRYFSYFFGLEKDYDWVVLHANSPSFLEDAERFFLPDMLKHQAD